MPNFERIREPNDYGNRGPGPIQVKVPRALHLWLQDAPSGTDLGAPQVAKQDEIHGVRARCWVHPQSRGGVSPP